MENLPDTYFHLRQEPGLSYEKKERCFIAARTEDVENFLRLDSMTVEYPFRASRHVFGKTMLDSDEAEAMLIKKQISKYFSPRAVGCYEGHLIEPVVNSLIHELRQNGSQKVNFHDALAQRIPTQVILAVFGIDVQYDIVIYEQLNLLVEYIDNPNNKLSKASEAKAFLFDFLNKCLDGEIIIDKSGLISSLDKSVFRNREDLLSTLLMVMTAGMATTIAAFTSLIIKMYKERNSLMRHDLEDRDFRKFVNELLNAAPPLHSTVRFAKSGFEYKGTKLKKYDTVKVLLASANEEQLCPVDHHSSNTRFTSYTFGRGKHACLGSQLAVSELVIFVRVFLPEMEFYTLDLDLLNYETAGSSIKTYKNVYLNRIAK